MAQPMLGKTPDRPPDMQLIQSGPAGKTARVSRKSVIGLAVLLSFSFVLNAVVAFEASSTTDEPHHLLYARRLLHVEADRVIPDYCDSQMPISVLNELPEASGSFLDGHRLLPSIASVLNRYKAARIATLFATMGLALLVYLWALELYGEGPAFAACLLCSLSPNLIAHGTLATTDMYFALGVVGSLYFVRRYLLQPTLRNAVVAGLVLALAQITKSFALVLYVVAFLAIVLVMLRQTQPRSLSIKRAVLFGVISAAWFLVIINVSFVFDRTFLPLSAYHFETASFQRLQQTPVLRRVAVPVPYPFLQGLDLMKRDEETGGTFGYIYLLGELRNPASPTFHAFKSYYAVVWFYKEPIALQILFLWGLFWVFRNRRFGDLITGEALLLTAAVILVVWLSFFNKAQIGIRHILPALAIETIIAGAAFSNFSKKSRPQKAVLGVLVLWLVGSVASYYPQMIPYVNEWVHERRYAYKIMADSNLDWGQEDGIVDVYLHQNPDVLLDPSPERAAGRILVRVNRLTGVDRWTPSAAYLDKQYRPVGMVGYAHLLFEVPPGDVPANPPKSAY
jgi:hypothetical protein